MNFYEKLRDIFSFLQNTIRQIVIPKFRRRRKNREAGSLKTKTIFWKIFFLVSKQNRSCKNVRYKNK